MPHELLKVSQVYCKAKISLIRQLSCMSPTCEGVRLVSPSLSNSSSLADCWMHFSLTQFWEASISRALRTYSGTPKHPHVIPTNMWHYNKASSKTEAPITYQQQWRGGEGSPGPSPKGEGEGPGDVAMKGANQDPFLLEERGGGGDPRDETMNGG